MYPFPIVPTCVGVPNVELSSKVNKKTAPESDELLPAPSTLAATMAILLPSLSKAVPWPNLSLSSRSISRELLPELP